LAFDEFQDCLSVANIKYKANASMKNVFVNVKIRKKSIIPLNLRTIPRKFT